jgi:hypothetical protein
MGVQFILSLTYNFIMCANIICYAYCSVLFFLLTFLSGLNFFLSGFQSICQEILYNILFCIRTHWHV